MVASRKGHLPTAILCMCSLLYASTSLLIAQSPTKTNPRVEKSAETKRLNNLQFRRGLKNRGLTELLDLHLKDYPPIGTLDTLIMMRDLKLTEFADPTRTLQERREAIEQANELLRQSIEIGTTHPKRFEWQFDLARSLIYDQAEPYFTNILYFGGMPSDFSSAVRYTQNAVNTLSSLSLALTQEYDRLENLPVDAFDRLERTGYVASVDALEPRIQYLQLWALFYDAVCRFNNDPIRIRRLNQIQTTIGKNSALIDTPHAQSHIQVQMLTLAGMTQRRLNKHSAARQLLELALIVANRLTDATARQNIQWAIDLAHLEQIRNEGDDGRYTRAQEYSVRLGNLLKNEGRNTFGLSLALALTQRSVYRSEASAIRNQKPLKAKRLYALSWQTMVDLTTRLPDQKNKIYAKVAELMPISATTKKQDPFIVAAHIANLLVESNGPGKKTEALLTQAVTYATTFLDNYAKKEKLFVPEIRYNRAVAYYRLGQIDRAIQDFVAIATRYESYEHAQQAAKYAVELAADMYRDPKLKSNPRVQKLFHDAASAVVTNFPGTQAGRYWRFYLAQQLETTGRFQEAADLYASVSKTHEHYLDARFARIRCLVQILQALVKNNKRDRLEIRRRTDEFFDVSRAFITQLSSNGTTGHSSATRNKTSDAYVAQVKVLTAEVQILPSIDRPAQALQTLADFEKNHGSLGYLLGRIWRVRLLAFEQLGRLDDAAEAIPAYLAADAEHAGPTLQTLYLAMADEADRLASTNHDGSASTKALVALLLAKQIVQWAVQQPEDETAATIQTLNIQLAEAYLRANQAAQALAVLEPLVDPSSDHLQSKTITNLRLEFAYAESLFQLNRKQDALLRFNKLATRLPQQDERRWQALLRDLQCRTSLGDPANDIIKVIKQQMFLYPKLAQSPLADKFQHLLRENQRRVPN